MLQHVQALAASLAFLSRIPVPSACLPAHPARALGYFPAAGFLLGFLACLPGLLGLFGDYPLLRGMIYVVLLAWLTRGLHWDGFADLCDAAGSNAHGEAFYRILKDSRLGAFGAMGLMLGGMTEAALAGACWMLPEPLEPLLTAPVIGRCLPALLLWAGPVREGAGLARTMLEGVSGRLVAVHGGVLIAAGLWGLGWMRLVMLFVLLGLGMFWLLRLARREAGLNGDFMGTAIIWGELAALTVAVV